MKEILIGFLLLATGITITFVILYFVGWFINRIFKIDDMDDGYIERCTVGFIGLLIIFVIIMLSFFCYDLGQEILLKLK